MGNSQSSSGTQFSSGGLSVVQSVKPCHLSGDPDLYGIGIRVGFYLQYLAAIIAIVTKVDKDFVGWRAAFVPLVAATFVGLCINSTGNGLVIMDWAIMLELVLGFPVFFALPVFGGIKTEYSKRGKVRLHKEYVKKLEPERESGFGQYREKIAIALGAVTQAEELIMDETPRRPQEVRRLVASVAQAALQYVTVIEERPAEAIDHARGNVEGQLRNLRSDITQLVENVPNDIEAVRAEVGRWGLREHHIAALMQIIPTARGAGDAENAIRETAKKEKVIRHEIKYESLVLKRIHDLGLVDTVSAGISLIIYSAYCFLTPWLFFFGLDRGAEAGCDVRVLFFLAPVSVYNHGFAIFLKVFAVFAAIIGLFVFGFGLMFLTIGLSKPFEKVVEDRRTSPDHGPQNQPAQPDINMTGALVPQTQRHVAHTHHHWVTRHLHDVRQQYHYYVNNSEEPSKKAVDKEINFNRHWWGFWLSLLLVETIVVVEMTIQVNNLTMGPLLSSTGQLIALLVGVFMLLLILYRCSVKLYKRLGGNGNFLVVRTVERWLHWLLRTPPPQPPSETLDPERTAGLVNGGQGHEQTGAQTGGPHIIGPRVEEIGEEPLPENRAM
jgi:hypothetical protein